MFIADLFFRAFGRTFLIEFLPIKKSNVPCFEGWRFTFFQRAFFLLSLYYFGEEGGPNPSLSVCKLKRIVRVKSD